MPLTRLTLAVFLFCTLPALAQQQPNSDITSGNQLSWPDGFAAWTFQAAPAKPWPMFPQQSEQASPPQPSLGQVWNDNDAERTLEELTHALAENSGDLSSHHPWVRVSRDGKMSWGVFDDETCYSIHSYVVARDGKDSDAVHRVSESTCVPANRYGVKTTVMKQESSDHKYRGDR